MSDDFHFENDEQWVIWNGSLGVLDTVTMGHIESNEHGKQAWLDEPYDMVGPFSFDELNTEGLIDFAACTIMSLRLWQKDQQRLRRESQIERSAAQERLFKEHSRFKKAQAPSINSNRSNEKEHRKLLNLSHHGELNKAEIKAAYRRVAQKTHPDLGGSHEQFIKITEARDALLLCVNN